MPRAELEFLIGEEWGKVLESHTAFRHLRIQAVDADHLVHREELIRLRVDAYRALDRVAGLEAVLTHLIFADIDVVRARQVVVVRRAQETVSVRCAF